MIEIGSEFHKMPTEKGVGFISSIDGDLVFSGRTAIETVLKEIPYAKKAALPSYCCDSMIEPFRRAGYEIEFYNINYSNGLCIDAQISEDTDLLLWCNYFGFEIRMPDFSDFKRRGGIIIEDITHSLLSKKNYDLQSDYLVASIRKWFPVNCGGYCASVNGKLHFTPTTVPPSNFIDSKSLAMQLKAEYLTYPNEQKKEIFLAMFGDSNHWLVENYSELCIDAYSKEYISCVDAVRHREIRRRNAHALYEGLADCVEFMFDEPLMDCPLFVPIILRKSRDDIRRYLVENGIYCPVHWSKPKADCYSELYDIELSLICDQRYNENDMQRIVSILKNKL